MLRPVDCCRELRNAPRSGLCFLNFFQPKDLPCTMPKDIISRLQNLGSFVYYSVYVYQPPSPNSWLFWVFCLPFPWKVKVANFPFWIFSLPKGGFPVSIIFFFLIFRLNSFLCLAEWLIIPVLIDCKSWAQNACTYNKKT